MANFDASTYGTASQTFNAPFKDYTEKGLAPDGVQPARLVSYKQIKDVKKEWQGKVSVIDEVHVLFEILGTTSRTYVATFGLRESWKNNAKLYLLFKNTFGPEGFPPGFEVSWFQNLPCKVNVVHRQSKNGTYAVVDTLMPDIPYQEIMSGAWRDNPESQIDPALDSPTSPWGNGAAPVAPAPPAPDLNAQIAALLVKLPVEKIQQAKAIREVLGDDAAFLAELRSQTEAPPAEAEAEEEEAFPAPTEPAATEEEEPTPKRGRGRPKGAKNKPKEESPAPQEDLSLIPEDEI